MILFTKNLDLETAARWRAVTMATQLRPALFGHFLCDPAGISSVQGYKRIIPELTQTEDGHYFPAAISSA
jgi:hypothetical protein